MPMTGSRTPVRQPPLAQQVHQILTERIRDGVYPPDSQIPPENELAAEFSVSRATVRSALGTIAARGLVVRRHGAGTFVTRLSRISNPLNEAIDFQELIASYGFEPSVEYVAFLVAQPSAKMAEALQIEVDTPVFESHKVFSADGEPVIYCVNTIPRWIFDEDLIEDLTRNPEIIEPIYDFLEERCGQRVEYHASKVYPAIAEECAFNGGLPLDPGAAVLVIDGVAFNAEECPLFHTFEYHHHPKTLMTLDLIRRRVSRR